MYSFQLAKFLSQLIASRRRKTPVHLDGEGKERKRSLKNVGGQTRFYSGRVGPKQRLGKRVPAASAGLY